MSNKTKCLIYANSRHENLRFIKEAEYSCQSFKQHLNNVHAVLYCDQADYKSQVFDDIVQAKFTVPENLTTRMHKQGQMLVKHQAMMESKYDYNLVLGSDTYALSSNVNTVFELLDNFDIAVAHAPFRVVCMPDSQTIPVPISFPEFNCDVIAYRKRDNVLKFIEQWQQHYRQDEFGHPHDQGTFRYLLYNSDLRIATLPPEFNYRGDKIRNDIVILQNRELLPEYLRQPQTSGKKYSLLEKVKEKLIR